MHDAGLRLHFPMSGGSESGQMQMRAVAFETGGHGPDPSRDRDAKTIWWRDVTGLDKHLAGVIERALPIGATPLKRIAMTVTAGAGTTAAAKTLKQRTLR